MAIKQRKSAAISQGRHYAAPLVPLTVHAVPISVIMLEITWGSLGIDKIGRVYGEEQQNYRSGIAPIVKYTSDFCFHLRVKVFIALYPQLSQPDRYKIKP